MAAILILEAIGTRAEELALEAGGLSDVAVGWDAELGCATFDADGLDEDGLRETVVEALRSLDPDWESHLRETE